MQNVMLANAIAGQGINSPLPSHEGMLFALFLGVAGMLMLTAAVLMVRRDSARHAVRYARTHRRSVKGAA
jgi:hypothetical protein